MNLPHLYKSQYSYYVEMCGNVHSTMECPGLPVCTIHYGLSSMHIQTVLILEWYVLVLRMETAHLHGLVLLIYFTVCIFSYFGTGIKCL